MTRPASNLWFPPYLLQSLRAPLRTLIHYMFLVALLLIPAATTDSAVTAILCLTASNFFLELMLGPAWAVPMDVGGTSSGTVTAVMNMVGAVGASISPLVFGMLVERGSWIAPFYVTAGILITGSLIWIFLIDPEKSVVERGASK
jgi:predicted MFS family arabinose efflux permease